MWNGFEPEGKIVRTTELLTNVRRLQDNGRAAGPTRSFGPPSTGKNYNRRRAEGEYLPTEIILKINKKAYYGEEDFLVKNSRDTEKFWQSWMQSRKICRNPERIRRILNRDIEEIIWQLKRIA